MKTPWLKWYPDDWTGDKGLRLCSLAARGLWHELCLIAHECVPYGHVRPGGRIPSADEIARLVGASASEVAKLIAELEGLQVFSRAADGTIVSRRMVRDANARLKAADNGRLGGNPNLRDKPGDNPPDNRTDKAGHNGVDKSHAQALRARAGSDSGSSLPESSFPGRDSTAVDTATAVPSAGSARPPPKAPRKKAEGPHPRLVQHWESEWARARGSQYDIAALDGICLATALSKAKGDVEEVLRRITRLLESGDPGDLNNASPAWLVKSSVWNRLGSTRAPAERNGHDFNEPKGYRGVREGLAGKQSQIQPLLQLVKPASIPGASR